MKEISFEKRTLGKKTPCEKCEYKRTICTLARMVQGAEDLECKGFVRKKGSKGDRIT